MLICSCCDRGQIYCAGGCAGLARREGQRAAAQRYQTSPALCDLLLSAWNRPREEERQEERAGRPRSWAGAVLAGCAGLLYAALFLTAYQTAWFFGCYVLLLALIHTTFNRSSLRWLEIST